LAAVGLTRLHLDDRVPQLLEELGRRLVGREGRLEQQTGLGELADLLRVEQRRDLVAAQRVAMHEPRVLEARESLPDGGLAHVEFVTEGGDVERLAGSALTGDSSAGAGPRTAGLEPRNRPGKSPSPAEAGLDGRTRGGA